MEPFEILNRVQRIEPAENHRTESTAKPFIEANTESMTLEEIRDHHIIPVFAKDNEPLISHADFIASMHEQVYKMFPAETILEPNIRVSHPIKGRVPDARNKPANALEEWEKTLYYERMMFVIEVPTIQDTIDGNTLSLTVGGVKSFNLDNLYMRKGTEEHFKLFVGFQNKVCTNLCVWSDGYQSDVRVKDNHGLKSTIKVMLESYRENMHLGMLKELVNYHLTEQQFALLMGRARMYHYLPGNLKKDTKPLHFTDTQLGAVVRDFYKDDSSCKDGNGNINLWRLYNLFTGANKSTYIDQYLERGVNAYDFAEQIRWALEGKCDNWYLN